jgi:hypothetical protein
MHIEITTELRARFWAKVDQTPGQGPKGDCWCWTGNRNWDDYGQFKVKGKTVRANRLAYLLAKGNPGILKVRHTCDNPPCVRPGHLILGTQQQNIADTVERGRWSCGTKGAPRSYEKQRHARDQRRARLAQIDWQSVNAARFWSQVEKSPDCWLWRGHTGTKSKLGMVYGIFNLCAPVRRNIGAHKFAYILTKGIVPVGVVVCHECDNPLCVRPSHLFLGTPSDNTQDALRKGRLASGDRHWTRQQPERARAIFEKAKSARPRLGEKNHAAKLTAEHAAEIIRLHEEEGLMPKAIMALGLFPVNSPTSIGNVINGPARPIAQPIADRAQ